MPKPAQKSTSRRRIKVNIPSGKAVIHYVRRKPNQARCGVCRKQLHGVASGFSAKVRALSKSERRPERPYGGNLCSTCMREAMKRKNLERWENV